MALAVGTDRQMYLQKRRRGESLIGNFIAFSGEKKQKGESFCHFPYRKDEEEKEKATYLYGKVGVTHKRLVWYTHDVRVASRDSLQHSDYTPRKSLF
jgi:hypothetical protein